MTRSEPLRRAGYLAYGVFCYALSLAAFLYAIGFVGGFWGVLGWRRAALHSLDVGAGPSATGRALLVDALLLALFALQHSGMARAAFKRRWTRIVPEPLERSTYVLATSTCLAILFWQWRPVGTTAVWNLSGSSFAPVLVGLSVAGWIGVFASSFAIDHFDLFGLRQVWLAFHGRSYPKPGFITPAPYRVVRHPIYLGFLVAFWATPTMSLAHLVFALATTSYVLAAIRLEERDLVRHHGDRYQEYRRRTPMLLPHPRAKGR
jgi:methanethiol S-methyltransferase